MSIVAVLLPDWEVLVIVSPETTPSNLDGYSCLFDTGEISPATFSGVLPFPDRVTFSCILPVRARRRLPFKQPLLSNSPGRESPPPLPLPLPLWSHMVYDSLTTDDDVVLFVKGVNVRQGINREPREFRCVFGDDTINGVKTAVTTSMQEVFRCKRPELTTVGGESVPAVKVSLEIVAENRVVPSVAYYTLPRKLESNNGKSLLCASTMVYDVAKFLKEWVLYHSKIGVEKFVLYDNGSDDDLQKSVDELVKQGASDNGSDTRVQLSQNVENRHKSIVLLDAIDDSLLNVIHHFYLRPGYKTKKLSTNSMVVNHYKYQAWPEFKAKFRRRVSAYVLDWTQKLNPRSNDRTPGLGFAPVEPRGWAHKFCEVRDNMLKDLTLRWFGISESNSGLKMAWQR
ncbi:hypothetical protein DH2020_004210 [Rehmannia glutinosa]|uniref:Glycosyltransferase family 92 protein n=1 Tax=Rehmannia glutinosa TaxID=99300 RepID=A0ABR0XNW6_REHGL